MFSKKYINIQIYQNSDISQEKNTNDKKKRTEKEIKRIKIYYISRK